LHIHPVVPTGMKLREQDAPLPHSLLYPKAGIPIPAGLSQGWGAPEDRSLSSVPL
jgi:hypothetical protein